MLNFFFGAIFGVLICAVVSFGTWWWRTAPNYDQTGRKLGFIEKLIS